MKIQKIKTKITDIKWNKEVNKSIEARKLKKLMIFKG